MQKNTKNFSFPSNLRLSGRNAYQPVMQKAVTKYGNQLVVHYSPNQLENPRLGIVVSKRINKKAVVRNYLKRIVRESFRQTQHQIKNFDVVVIVRYALEKNHTLHDQLNIIWKRLSH